MSTQVSHEGAGKGGQPSLCQLKECRKPIPEERVRHGLRVHFPARTCSADCSYKLRQAEHPRQTRIEFTPPTEPPLIVTAPVSKERKLKMQKAGWRILTRLEKGPASMVEVMTLAKSPRYGARIGEIKDYLRVLCGYPMGADSPNPVLCLYPKSANPLYMLSDWAEPGNRPHASSIPTGELGAD